MSFYENTECPVCHKQFCEDDIIVTCPVCGTPHHKECYDEIGHCVNKNLHKTGYDYVKEHKKSSTTANPVFNVNQEYYQPEAENDNTKAEVNQKQSEGKTQTPPNPFNMLGANTVATAYDNDSDTIESKSIADVAVGIGINAPKFIGIFKAFEKGEKKFKWNWCAFIFGSFYLFARKMYKQGIAFLCLEAATFFTGMGCIFKFAPTYTAYAVELYNQMGTSDAIDMKKYQMIMESEEAMLASTIMFAMLAVVLIIHIVAGLWANRIYKKTVINNINKVEKMISEGKQLQMPVMFSVSNPPTMEDLKKMQISRKGGISLMAPVLAYMALETLLMLITYIQ